MTSPERGITLIEMLIAVTLLSLLSVAVLFGMRIGLNAMERSNDRLMTNRKVLGVERVLTQQIAGMMPVMADCVTNPQAPPARLPFFQGEPETMRFVSSYSLNEAGRGYPRVLEYQVIAGENGAGVRLIVNESWYSGPTSAGSILHRGLSGPDSGIADDAISPGPDRIIVLCDRGQTGKLPVLPTKKRSSRRSPTSGPSAGFDAGRRTPSGLI